MAGNFERKSRDIKRSLVRRARMRKAYYKMVGEETGGRESRDEEKGGETESREDGNSSKRHEGKAREVARPRLDKRQLAKQKRQEAYHQLKEREEARAKAEKRREHKRGTVQKRTSRGQPKLGSRVGMLLEKLKQDQQ